jgi:6-phosphogluconolactonase
MSARNDVHVFNDERALFASAAALVGASAAEAIAARGYFGIALTGGSAAKGLYPVLAARAELVEWVRTKVWFIDERAVPPADPESNYRLADELLLSKVPVSKDHVFRMRAEDPDPDWAARDYAKTLPERLDLITLGMGPDGHLCSLFPGFPQLGETERLVVPVDGSPKPPPRRMTITPPVLAAARRTMMIVTGADKAEMVAKALSEGPAKEVPSRLVRTGTWLLSREAASRL